MNQMSRLLGRATLTVALLLGSAVAVAGEIMPVSMAAYQAAAAKGAPVIFHVKADWCPVCAKQTPIIAKLMAEPAFAKYLVLVVDFDRDKNALGMLKVDHQSTIIVNKGAAEVGRTTGLTDEKAIRDQLMKAG